MIYVIHAPSMNAVKIGFAESDVDRRIRELQCGHPEPYRLLVVFPGTREDEAALHARFAEYHLHLEWFRYEDALVRFTWDMGDQRAPVPDPLPLSDVWQAICRFDDRPVRLRQILTALAAGDVELEDPIEQRGDFHEGHLHTAVRAFLSIERTLDSKALERLFHLSRPPLDGWTSPDDASYDSTLARMVAVYVKLRPAARGVIFLREESTRNQQDQPEPPE